MEERIRKNKKKEYYEKALAIAVEIGDKRTEAVICSKLGKLFRSPSGYVMAEAYLEKALSISKETRAGEIEFACYCYLTLTKLSQEKFEESLSYLFQSIEKYEELQGLNAESDQIKISFADQYALPYLKLSALLCDAGNFNDAPGADTGGWIGWISTPHFSVNKNSNCHFI